VAARIAVAVVAVLVLAWLGVMERDRRLEARGVTTAGALDSAADVRAAEADLRAAELLNPDTRPALQRALVLRYAGRLDEAIAVVQDVTEREPENRAAWGGLFALARERSPALAQRARAALRRLDPLNVRAD
jgi:Tetratricopeptide repeat